MPVGLWGLVKFWGIVIGAVVVLVVVACPGVVHRIVFRPLLSLLGWGHSVLLGPSKRQLVHGGRRVVVARRQVGEKSPCHFTEVCLYLRPSDRQGLFFELYPRGKKHPRSKIFAQADVTVVTDDFEKHYEINCGPTTDVTTLFSPALCVAIQRFHDLSGRGELYVRLDGCHFVAMTEENPRYCPDPGELYRRAVAIFDVVLEAPATSGQPDTEGLEFLPEEGGEERDSLCQVCGETIEGACVLCAYCRTPHHADCWDYCGECSTYGCGCTRKVSHTLS